MGCGTSSTNKKNNNNDDVADGALDTAKLWGPCPQESNRSGPAIMPSSGEHSDERSISPDQRASSLSIIGAQSNTSSKSMKRVRFGFGDSGSQFPSRPVTPESPELSSFISGAASTLLGDDGSMSDSISISPDANHGNNDASAVLVSVASGGSPSQSTSSMTNLSMTMLNPWEAHLRPNALPVDYPARVAAVAAASEDTCPDGNVNPFVWRGQSTETQRCPLSLPLHRVSRFYPRQPGCFFDRFYQGPSTPDKAHAMLIDTPAQRQITQVDELLVSRRYTGAGLPWPHPLSANNDDLIICSLWAMEGEIDPTKAINEETKVHIRDCCVITKKLLLQFHHLLLVGGDLKQLIPHLSTLREYAAGIGLFRLSSVLLNAEAIIIDIQCLETDPVEFLSLVRNSVGRHFLHEYHVEYPVDLDQPPEQPKPTRPSIEEYLKKRFLVDLSYCYQLARKFYKQTSKHAFATEVV